MSQWLKHCGVDPDFESPSVQDGWHICTLNVPIDKATAVLTASGHLGIFSKYPRKMQMAASDKVAVAKVDMTLEHVKGCLMLFSSTLGILRFKGGGFGIRVPIAVKPEVENILGTVQWLSAADDSAMDFRLVFNPPQILEGLRLTDLQQQLSAKLLWQTINLRIQTQMGSNDQEDWLQSHDAPSHNLATLSIQGEEAEVTIFSIARKKDPSAGSTGLAPSVHLSPSDTQGGLEPAQVKQLQSTIVELQEKSTHQKLDIEELQFIVARIVDASTLEALKKQFRDGLPSQSSEEAAKEGDMHD
jgi:hypothetical protein